MRLELPSNKRLVRSMTIPIRWGDMDAMGHVNNTVYFRYLETVRIDWMREIGCLNGPHDHGPVVLNAFCNFHRQVRYPGDLQIKLYVSDAARTTFETWVTIERSDQPGVISASGGATVIWIDPEKEKAVALPDWMRAIVEGKD
jgi:acyl-CoA thioester hydrolase